MGWGGGEVRRVGGRNSAGWKDEENESKKINHFLSEPK